MRGLSIGDPALVGVLTEEPAPTPEQPYFVSGRSITTTSQNYNVTLDVNDQVDNTLIVAQRGRFSMPSTQTLAGMSNATSVVTQQDSSRLVVFSKRLTQDDIDTGYVTVQTGTSNPKGAACMVLGNTLTWQRQDDAVTTTAGQLDVVTDAPTSWVGGGYFLVLDVFAAWRNNPLSFGVPSQGSQFIIGGGLISSQGYHEVQLSGYTSNLVETVATSSQVSTSALYPNSVISKKLVFYYGLLPQ
jgi:hypothetical protein